MIVKVSGKYCLFQLANCVKIKSVVLSKSKVSNFFNFFYFLFCYIFKCSHSISSFSWMESILPNY